MLLTVDDLPAGSTVRLAIYGPFRRQCGTCRFHPWLVLSLYHRVGDSITNNATGKRFTAKILINDGLSDYLAADGRRGLREVRHIVRTPIRSTTTPTAIHPSRTSPGFVLYGNRRHSDADG